MSKARVPVEVAEKIGEKYGHPVVIIFGLNPDEKSFRVTTYGDTRRTSNLAAAYGSLVAGAILGGMTQVTEELPHVPAQWEGKLKEPWDDQVKPKGKGKVGASAARALAPESNSQEENG